MKKTGLAGLASYAARGKQYLVMIRPCEGGLVMQQLRYADEVKPFSEVPLGESTQGVKDAELNLAVQLIQQSVSQTVHPENYKDEVKKRVQEIISQKVQGQEVTLAPEEPVVAPVIDLMEALKASLAQVSGGAAPKPAAAAPPEPARMPARSSPRKGAEKTAPAESGAATGGRRKKAGG